MVIFEKKGPVKSSMLHHKSEIYLGYKMADPSLYKKSCQTLANFAFPTLCNCLKIMKDNLTWPHNVQLKSLVHLLYVFYTINIQKFEVRHLHKFEQAFEIMRGSCI